MANHNQKVAADRLDRGSPIRLGKAKARADWKKVLTDWWNRKGITKKPHINVASGVPDLLLALGLLAECDAKVVASLDIIRSEAEGFLKLAARLEAEN